LHFWQKRRIQSTVAPARNWPYPHASQGSVQSAACPILTLVVTAPTRAYNLPRPGTAAAA
jgi:hypothetical protein